MYVGEIANAIELAPTRVAWMRLDVGSCYHRSTSDSPNLAIQCAKKKQLDATNWEDATHQSSDPWNGFVFFCDWLQNIDGPLVTP